MTNDIHWLIRYDPEDGEPYGTVCDCVIGADHDSRGDLIDLVDDDDDAVIF